MGRACRHCGGELEVVRDCPPHYGRFRCVVCSRGGGFAPTPLTPADVAEYRMPIGCRRGETLATIAATARGRDYLRWASVNLTKPRMRLIISFYLLTLEPVEADR